MNPHYPLSNKSLVPLPVERGPLQPVYAPSENQCLWLTVKQTNELSKILGLRQIPFFYNNDYHFI